MRISQVFTSGVMAAGLVLVLGTVAMAEKSRGGASGNSSTSASAGGSSSASASVGGSSSCPPGSSRPSGSPAGGGLACDASRFDSKKYVWKVSDRRDCGCGWKKVNSARKWMCPVSIRTAKAK